MLNYNPANRCCVLLISATLQAPLPISGGKYDDAGYDSVGFPVASD
jgi:hypothetical protein